MKARAPQLPLRLDAATPVTDASWGAGRRIAYLGGTLLLKLDTACCLPERIGDELHLPLPPAATPRQVRDAAESWLRDEALRLFAEKSALAGCNAPHGMQPLRVTLCFGKRGDWARGENGVLRCHWRLIEQPLEVIEQVLRRAAGEAQAQTHCDDLFALA